jgi:3-oxoacyl-[acyl-carrier protein] reductase
MNLQLEDRTALVTSATKGIGFGIAAALTAEGCKVIISSSNAANLADAADAIERESGRKPATFVLDVTSQELVRSALDAISRAHPTIDILITNAPGPKTGPALDIDDSELTAAMQTNIASVVQLCRRFVPGMTVRGFGRVVNIASTVGREPEPNMALSALTRAAIMGYAKSLAREVASKGVTVNTILTGGVLSDRTRQLLAADAARAGEPLDDFVAKVGRQVFPIGYIATPEQFAQAIVFLCSPQAAYVTGVNLPIDGGLMRAL